MSNWIAISDRVPEAYSYVLVYAPDFTPPIRQVQAYNWTEPANDHRWMCPNTGHWLFSLNGRVTHWRPMPSVPTAKVDIAVPQVSASG